MAAREDLRHHAFVSYVDDLLFTKELQFLDRLDPPERFALRSTSVTAQYEAVRAGAGLAVRVGRTTFALRKREAALVRISTTPPVQGAAA